MRELVQISDMSLQAYLTSLRWRMWASPVEMCIAAETLGIEIGIIVNQDVIIDGWNLTHVLKLHNNHYTLHQMKQAKRRATGYAMMGREGMNSSEAWTWEEQPPQHLSITSMPTADPLPE